MVKFTFDIENEIHSKFKSYCASSKISMKQALTIAIKLILKKGNRNKNK